MSTHSWQLHLHIMWRPKERRVDIDDEAVAERIKENASDKEVMETALRTRQERIASYEAERHLLQKAAGQFAVFLKNSSIKPYNDSKLEYLDHLIEDHDFMRMTYKAALRSAFSKGDHHGFVWHLYRHAVGELSLGSGGGG